MHKAAPEARDQLFKAAALIAAQAGVGAQLGFEATATVASMLFPS